jgi:hypothetical protein
MPLLVVLIYDAYALSQNGLSATISSKVVAIVKKIL